MKQIERSLIRRVLNLEEKLVALRILICSLDRKTPSSEDIQLLRSLKPERAELSADELAYSVLNDLSAS